MSNKKDFKWKLISYGKNSMTYSFAFEHPKYISVGGVDIMKMSFTNTKDYMAPESESLQSIPDGY